MKGKMEDQGKTEDMDHGGYGETEDMDHGEYGE